MVLSTPFVRWPWTEFPTPMCIQDGIGIEEQTCLVEYSPEIDEDEMLHYAINVYSPIVTY